MTGVFIYGITYVDSFGGNSMFMVWFGEKAEKAYDLLNEAWRGRATLENLSPADADGDGEAREYLEDLAKKEAWNLNFEDPGNKIEDGSGKTALIFRIWGNGKRRGRVIETICVLQQTSYCA